MRSRTRGLLSLLLVVCVVLAGCNGVFGGDTQETSTLTPAAVPTDEPTRTPLPQLAPGLTGEGVVNASALAAAHHATLEDTSYTARRTVTYRTPNGTPVRRIESVTRVADDGRFRITRRWNGSTSLRRVAYYHDGDRLLVATTDTDDATTYRRASPGTVVAQRSSVAAAGSRRIETMFVAGETVVAGRTERNGTTIYRLVPATPRRPPETATGLDRSVSVEARVTDRGRVRSYTLVQRLSGEGADGAATIVVSTRYSRVGSTDVDRPAWYESALAATDATTANRTATGTEAGTTTAAARTPGTAMARNRGRERRAPAIAVDQAS